MHRRPAVGPSRSAARPITWSRPWRRKATIRGKSRSNPRSPPNPPWSSANWRATIAYSSATSPNSLRTRSACCTLICKAAATWCSFSAIRCWPSDTTASWPAKQRAADEGRAGEGRILPARLARSSSSRNSASIRSGFGIRSCRPFAAGAKPRCLPRRSSNISSCKCRKIPLPGSFWPRPTAIRCWWKRRSSADVLS